MKNTMFWYTYTDMLGRKKTHSFVLGGLLSDEMKASINKSLRNGENFIPSQVGLEALNGDTDNDQVWHKIDVSGAVSTMNRANIELNMTTADLAERFSETVWNPQLETMKLHGKPNDMLRVSKVSAKRFGL